MRSLKPFPVLIKINLLALLALLSIAGSQASGDADQEGLKAYTTSLPFAMSAVQLPRFPDRTFRIEDFGAIGDGLTLNTEAFEKAIDACAQAGGGRVLVPAGIWRTGPIKLKSLIDLHLEKNALILFSGRFEDYPIVETLYEGARSARCMSPISGYKLGNIAITGEGIIDGSGDAWRPVKKFKMTDAQWKKQLASGGAVDHSNTWWPSVEAMNGAALIQRLEKSGRKITKEEYAGAREFLRPVMVSLVECNKVLLDGITFQNSPAWNIHPLMCEELVIRNVTVLNPWYSQNGDGLDLESCRRAVVYRCSFDVGDDAICIKSGKDESGRRRGRPCEEIVIADCVVYHGHGGFTVGSEMSGGVRNISVKRCTFLGTDVGLRFKTTRGRGGVVEKVYISDIRMKDIPTDAIGFNMYYGGDAPIPEPDAKATPASRAAVPIDEGTPRFQSIFLKNIICTGAERAALLEGLPEMAIRDIELEDVLIAANRGLESVDADQIRLKNVRILPKRGPVISLKDSRNVMIQKASGPDGADVFLKLDGGRTGSIRLQDTDISRAKKGIEQGATVPAGAIIKP
jgi:polygalacturonase